ncbi:hypothetical protein ANASTE_02028 [Anaerofustis stercorihominis DSM 17244]|uniref:Uncharacterized protein n=1 Tax=Anaerofustis stercorihominis DSM 17244 TaxID=445971 RepID=B1C9Z4_9FIRM|nr:hypothetical protein ANASTE_02028 [Anaerofustis stercorihominis DSM 17244]
MLVDTKKIVKLVFLVMIDILFMAITYVICNTVFNANNLAIDPAFPKYIPLLIVVKLLIYFIAGLYKDETRGIIFEIGSVTFANLLVFILLRFIFKIGVSTYLQLIALTVDIIVETISRSLLLSVIEVEEIYEDDEETEQSSLPQVFDDPIDYREELKLNKIKKELLANKAKQEEKQKQTEESLNRLKEMEERLRKKEQELKNFEHTLSLKELNIQEELEKLEKEKQAEKELSIKQKQKSEQQEILDGVLDNIKTIHTSLNERSKIVDMQEHDLMLKMYDITKKEIEAKQKEEPRKKKNLSDKELLEATYKKIGQKRKRTNPYIKQKAVIKTQENKSNNQKNKDKKLSEALLSSPLINDDKKLDTENANDFLKSMYDEAKITSKNKEIKRKNISEEKIGDNILKTDINVNNEEKPKKQPIKKQSQKAINNKQNSKNIKNNKDIKKEEIKSPSTKKQKEIKKPEFTKEELKIINMLNDNNNKNLEKIKNKKDTSKYTKNDTSKDVVKEKDQVDLLFSEDDFDKIADLIDKL